MRGPSRRRPPVIVDRYVLRYIAQPFLTIIATIIALLSIEHLPTLLHLAEHIERPRAFVLMSMASLIPEYLAIGLVAALLLGVSLAARQLALRSELDAFRATGLSDFRLLRAPLLLGVAIGLALLLVRFEAQPLGEQRLLALGDQLSSGAFGIDLAPRDFVALGRGTTLHFDRAAADRHSLDGIFIRSGDQVIWAAHGTIEIDRGGAFVLRLRDGAVLTRHAGRPVDMAQYEALGVSFPSNRPPPARTSARDQRASMTLGELRQHIAGARTIEQRRQLLAVALSRLAIAIVLAMATWPAFLLGLPARRQPSGAGIGLCILLIVLIVRTTAWIADGGAAAPLWAFLAVILGWSALFGALIAADRRYGNGFVDALAGRAVRRLRRLRPRVGPSRMIAQTV
jgi:lipopolysaccharide export LptBFGC system permease protein LptF